MKKDNQGKTLLFTGAPSAAGTGAVQPALAFLYAGKYCHL
jgi:hypothetical protein